MTDQQRFVFNVFLGRLILERQEDVAVEKKGGVYIGDLHDCHELMERAFLAGWAWGNPAAESEES